VLTKFLYRNVTCKIQFSSDFFRRLLGWGFSSAADRQRLQALLHRGIRAQSEFYLPHVVKGLLLTVFIFSVYCVCTCADAFCHFCLINEYDNDDDSYTNVLIETLTTVVVC